MCFTLQVAGADGTAIIGHNAQMAELALQIGEGDLQQGFQRLLQTLDPCSNRDKSVPVQQVSNANLIRVRVRVRVNSVDSVSPFLSATLSVSQSVSQLVCRTWLSLACSLG